MEAVSKKMHHKFNLPSRWRMRKRYWKDRCMDAQHANHVLQKAIDDTCSGRVTVDELKAWRRTGYNPIKEFTNET